MAFDAETAAKPKTMVADDRLSGSNNSDNDRTRRLPNFSSAKSRGLPERMNRRRDLLLVEELSIIGEAAYESSIGSSSASNRQAPSAAALVTSHRDDEDHIYGPGRNPQLHPCSQTTEVLWTPEEQARTTHPKGAANSITRWRVFNRSVKVIIESRQPPMSTSSIVNKATAPKNEEEEECVGEWSPEIKEEGSENGQRNQTKKVSFIIPSRRWRCCALYQTSRVFQGSVLVSVALLLCSIALLGVTIGVRNKGNLQQQHHSGSASSIRRGPTLPPSAWSDSSRTTTTLHPSLYPSHMQSSIPTGALSNVPSDVPSLLPSNTSPSIPSTSEPTQITSIAPSRSSLAAPSYAPSGIPSISISPTKKPLNASPPTKPSVTPSVGPTNVPSEAPSISPLVVQTSTEPSIMSSAFLPTATDVFVGPAPPEVNWPF